MATSPVARVSFLALPTAASLEIIAINSAVFVIRHAVHVSRDRGAFATIGHEQMLSYRLLAKSAGHPSSPPIQTDFIDQMERGSGVVTDVIIALGS
ncbi:hypothetical protein HDV57DRAFT_320523 [Trichoderma longibrachiatum]